MADTVDGWNFDKAYPLMLAVAYRNALHKVVAEWMRAAKATCAEDYHLSEIAEKIEAFVVRDIKDSLPGHGSFPTLRVGGLITPKEDD